MCTYNYTNLTSQLGTTQANNYNTIWYILCNGDNTRNMERDGFKPDCTSQEQVII